MDNVFLLFNAIIDSRTDVTQIEEGNSFIHTENTILDTRMYEVEYNDRYKTVMTANAIARN